ncbi:hypothetical protein [Stenotrophomonas geniculata]|uniref:hypothetical protein n=1 Tax=Stenotrophomonas geniculata TaxID=86188 RepID=UPI002E772D0B|nr:hypothetical protein [Stenotrophomonas geniculata]
MGKLTNRRHAGHRIGGGRRTKAGPLREIDAILEHGRSLFDVDYVLLVCGHFERATIGVKRARCTECGRLAEATVS